MQESLPDFVGILAALDAHKGRFVLICGLAMIAHGCNHVTQDLDVGYARDRHNTQALAEALNSAHPRLRNFPPDLPFEWSDRTIRSLCNLTLDTELAAVDLLGEISGIASFEALWQRSVEME